MRKFMLLAMILIFSTPVYSTVLVYKLTTSFNPLVDINDSNQFSAAISKPKLTTYLIFSVDVNGFAVNIPPDTNNLVDVNVITEVNGVREINVVREGSVVRDGNRPIAIVSGTIKNTRFQLGLGGGDTNSTVNINTITESNSIKPFTVVSNSTTNVLLFIDIVDDNSITLSVQVFGRTNSFLAGSSTLVAAKLKGNSELIDFTDNIAGFGKASATLSTKYTNAAQTRNLTVAQTAALIQSDLTKKRFVITTALP